MVYQQTFKVFRERSLSSYLDGLNNHIQSLIDGKSEDYILNVNETEYTNSLVDEYTVSPLNIDFENKSITGYEKQIPAEDFLPYFNVEEGHTYKKLAVIYHLPYTGNESLLECYPSTRIAFTTEVFLDNQCLCFEVISLDENAEEIKGKAERILDDLKTQLGYLATEVDRYITSLPAVVKQLFQERRQYFLDKNQKLAFLGVPVKKREDLPETYTIPTPEFRKSVNVEPRVTEKGYKIEPKLPDSTYQDILQTIHDLGKQFERLPAIYSGKDEEALRDHILFYLEPSFEGSATGETFNKTGKTDILIRHESSNAFIAECKFWRRQKAYLDTITQLLGYLTWRDSKSCSHNVCKEQRSIFSDTNCRRGNVYPFKLLRLCR